MRRRRYRFELSRDGLEPERYAYLSIADSELYDRVRKSRNGKDLEIKRLLEDKAFAAAAAHRQSRQ